MEPRSQEYASLCFHQKLKRMHKIAFYYNLGHEMYVPAVWHLFAFTIESVMVEYHKRHQRPTFWSEKKPGTRMKAVSGD